MLAVRVPVSAQEPQAAPAAKPAGEGTSGSADQPVELVEEITVTAGHADRRIQDVPVRVEVVDREEIEEKALMTPGSVAMLLGETTGLRGCAAATRCCSPTACLFTASTGARSACCRCRRSTSARSRS